MIKEISTSCWAPYHKCIEPIPITNPLILAKGNTLYYFYDAGGPANFYYRLAGNVLYNILNENDYFDEEN